MNEKREITQCIYTIINSESIIEALENNGEGIFIEGRPWASGARRLSTLALGEPYPLLLGDAATTSGVEWVAMIENIELLGDGGTRITFSSLCELENVIPLNALRKVSDGQPLSLNYIRPYVPCDITGEERAGVLAAILNKYDYDDAEALEVIGEKTSEEYIEALTLIEKNMSPKQRAMLTGHAMAFGNRLSMQTLAEIGGYPKFQSANIQYGKLGRQFADFFHVTGLSNQTQAMAWSDDNKDEFGHFTWVLREPLVEALQSLGWIPKPKTLTFDALVAAEEIDADPQCAKVSVTVRQALINARIGQGEYRQRMLNLWGAKCALTGCELTQVLIASHAKSWKNSTNEERLDEYNGFLLAAHVDKLFDIGLITFSNDGKMMKKNEISIVALKILGLSENHNLSFIDPRHIPYLEAHRDQHGF